MPESPEDLYARVSAAAGPDGRLPLPDMSDWEPFPWDVVDGRLVAKVLDPPTEEDRPRAGLDGEDCGICASATSERVVWENDRFFVSTLAEASGLLVLFLQTREHLDYPDMDDDLAGECGRLSAILCRVMERLPGVGRTHVCRWGDGAEHHHVWFIARPERFAQIAGSFAIEWDSILPPVPADVRRGDLAEIARHLATHDGRAMVQ